MKNKMAETMREAVTFIEQGHVRIGPNTVTEPAHHVTRAMEDFVTWADTSKIKRKVMKYNDRYGWLLLDILFVISAYAARSRMAYLVYPLSRRPTDRCQHGVLHASHIPPLPTWMQPDSTITSCLGRDFVPRDVPCVVYCIRVVSIHVRAVYREVDFHLQHPILEEAEHHRLFFVFCLFFVRVSADVGGGGRRRRLPGDSEDDACAPRARAPVRTRQR